MQFKEVLGDEEDVILYVIRGH